MLARVKAIPFKQLWIKGAELESERKINKKLFEPNEKIKIFNVNFFQKFRMPYKLVLADIPIQDDERGKIVASCVTKMVDFIEKNKKKIFEKTEDEGIKKKDDWENSIKDFSLLTEEKLVNEFEKEKLEEKMKQEIERVKQMGRIKKRRKELDIMLKEVIKKLKKI